jgi:hypothetical protein
MKWGIAALLLLSNLETTAAIYKCTEPDGRIRYQQIPCQEHSEELNTQEAPASVVEGGLRESEVRLLEGLEQSQKPPPETTPVEENKPEKSADSASCGDIQISNFKAYSKPVAKPFERNVISGRISYGTQRKQCANIQLQLPGYRNRLNISNTANEIARRLIARLADGTARRGEDGLIKDDDNRFARGKTYSGNFCFGTGKVEVIAVGCH